MESKTAANPRTTTQIGVDEDHRKPFNELHRKPCQKPTQTLTKTNANPTKTNAAGRWCQRTCLDLRPPPPPPQFLARRRRQDGVWLYVANHEASRRSVSWIGKQDKSDKVECARPTPQVRLEPIQLASGLGRNWLSSCEIQQEQDDYDIPLKKKRSSSQKKRTQHLFYRIKLLLSPIQIIYSKHDEQNIT